MKILWRFILYCARLTLSLQNEALKKNSKMALYRGGFAHRALLVARHYALYTSYTELCCTPRGSLHVRKNGHGYLH